MAVSSEVSDLRWRECILATEATELSELNRAKFFLCVLCALCGNQTFTPNA